MKNKVAVGPGITTIAANKNVASSRRESQGSQPKTQSLSSHTDNTRFSLGADGRLKMPTDRSLICRACGLEKFDRDTVFVLLSQMGCAQSYAEASDPIALNFCVDTAAGMAPKDGVETLLIAQMIATHSSAMALLANKQHRDASRLLRTFASQVEALRNYRRKGEQTIRYQHVHVSEGGQAIVGNLITGEGEK
jgi:hypothetical protein